MVSWLKHAKILICGLTLLSVGGCDQANFAGQAGESGKPSEGNSTPSGVESDEDARVDAPVPTGGAFLASLSCNTDASIIELDPNLVGVGCNIVDENKLRIPITADSVTDIAFHAASGQEITISIQSLIDQLSSSWHWNLHVPKDVLKGSQFKVKYFDKWLVFKLDELPGGIPLTPEISLLSPQEQLYGIRIGNNNWDPSTNQDCIRNGQWQEAAKAPLKGEVGVYRFKATGETVINISGICGVNEGLNTPVYVRRRSDQKILNTTTLKANVVSVKLTFKNPNPNEEYELVFTTQPTANDPAGDADDYHIRSLVAKGDGLKLLP